MADEADSALPLELFSYRPLGPKDIRLITISPGPWNAEIRCNLAQLTWAEVTSYRASTIGGK